MIERLPFLIAVLLQQGELQGKQDLCAVTRALAALLPRRNAEPGMAPRPIAEQREGASAATAAAGQPGSIAAAAANSGAVMTKKQQRKAVAQELRKERKAKRKAEKAAAAAVGGTSAGGVASDKVTFLQIN